MKLRGHIIAVLMVCSMPPLAVAQSTLEATSGEQYVPRLGDIMNAVQIRHMKLWFAGKALNWQLAVYELRQLKAGVVEAACCMRAFPRPTSPP